MLEEPVRDRLWREPAPAGPDDEDAGSDEESAEPEGNDDAPDEESGASKTILPATSWNATGSSATRLMK